MQNIFTNIKCSEIILSNANENWYIKLYDLFSRLCYIATYGPFCKDATHICNGNVEISRIKVLNLTHFSYYFYESYSPEPIIWRSII